MPPEGPRLDCAEYSPPYGAGDLIVIQERSPPKGEVFRWRYLPQSARTISKIMAD